MDWILLKIKAVRESLDLSQKEMADKIGVDLKTYSNWERGVTDLTFRNLQRIADALKINVKVFWDPDQFENPNWKPNDEVKFIIGPVGGTRICRTFTIGGLSLIILSLLK